MIGNVIAGMFAEGVSGDFESIATVSVGVSGSATIDFSSIPSTYQHLQIRAIGKATGAGHEDLLVRVGNGSLDTGSNYTRHALFGQGTSAASQADINQSYARVADNWAPPSSGSIYGVIVIEILDYANTNKFKTFRSLNGRDSNGSGAVGLFGNLWRSTSAIDTIRLYPAANSFAQYSHFALYGIKG